MTKRQPSPRPAQPAVNRRGFLKAVAATAGAATAVGAGAGWLHNRGKTAPITTLARPATVLSTPTRAPALPLAAGNDELLVRLAAAQAENVRLTAELDAVRRTAAPDPTAVPTDDGVLRQQLATAQSEIGLLSGLVALYDQLEATGIDDAVVQGLSAVDGAVDEWLSRVPGFDESLANGRQLLNNMEAHIPLLENGRLWLDNQLLRLGQYYVGLEAALQAAVDTFGSFLQMLNDWFQDVARWLPFGVGDRAAVVMDALTQLLTETDPTLSGLRANIAEPLDVWLGAPDEEAPLTRHIIRPLREQTLAAAEDAVARGQTIQDTYRAQLAEPVRGATDRRRLLQQMITDYRTTHNL